MEKEEEYMTV